MPGIAIGRRGIAAGFAAPKKARGVPRGDTAVVPFINTRRSSYNPSISGVTRDGSGNPLGNCAVHLYRTWDDFEIAQVTSDGSGNFILYPPSSGPYYIVAYLPGSPDVAGTTVNTLVAS